MENMILFWGLFNKKTLSMKKTSSAVRWAIMSVETTWLEMMIMDIWSSSLNTKRYYLILLNSAIRFSNSLYFLFGWCYFDGLVWHLIEFRVWSIASHHIERSILVLCLWRSLYTFYDSGLAGWWNWRSLIIYIDIIHKSFLKFSAKNSVSLCEMPVKWKVFHIESPLACCFE